MVAAIGRQDVIAASAPVSKLGVDFGDCVEDPDTGLCCVEMEETITSLENEPFLACTHKNVEKCHYTYATRVEAIQEEICNESFEKTCQITFTKQFVNDTVEKCHKPLIKNCNGQGEEVCKTVHETSCSTKHIEIQPGEF